MPRPPRINPRDGIHHVTNHRAGDEDLFLTDRDYVLFLSLLHMASVETNVVILEYCLMPNHYHLVVRCPSGSLDKFVHYLQGNSARAFNHRHDRKGPVFQRRYHNVLITTDEQFQLTCRYVNRNPAELGYDIADYPWSSYHSHKTGTHSSHEAVLIDQTMMLAMFGSAAAYVDFVEKPMGQDKFSLAGKVRRMVVRQATPDEALARLCEVVAVELGVEIGSLRSSARGRRNEPRLIATLVATDYFVAECDAICHALGYSSAATYRTALNRARRFDASDEQFAAKVGVARRGWSACQRDAA